MANNRICVGVITGSFGVRGEARIKSFCAEPAAIADYSPLSNEDGSVSYQITLTRPVKGGFAARIKGIIDKEAADSLKGTRLFADRGDLPNLPDDEYYHADLIGLRVEDKAGKNYGVVVAVRNYGASDLLEVAEPPKKTGALIPFIDQFVPEVDLAGGRVVIEPVPGLFDEPKAESK